MHPTVCMLRVALGALAALAPLAAGCAGETRVRSDEPASKAPAVTDARERSLHPPGSRPAAIATVDGPALSSLLAGRVHPGLDVRDRMQFLEAIDNCGRSTDPAIRADALALRKVFEQTADAKTFLEALAGRFEAVECVPAEQSSRGRMGLVTGYATPVVRAKRARDSFARFPLLVDLRRRFPEVAEAPRREILATPGVDSQAIAWVSDAFSWALIETNGSARLVFDDGIEPSELFISRVATNGRPWTGMGRWFAERGLIDKPDFTLVDVRSTAYVHPEKAMMAALDNERVVYFTIAEPSRFPTTVGLAGGRLIPSWSCAADQSIYPPGSILLIVEESRGDSYAHLVFVHDSGGAIAGPQRVDCYLGEGEAAIARAGEMRGPARIYRLRATQGAE